MSIRYTRDYAKILDDLSLAISTVPQFYETFEMDDGEWSGLADKEKAVCLRTLADDVFYALGSLNATEIGSGLAEYDSGRGIIKVTASTQLVHVVALNG